MAKQQSFADKATKAAKQKGRKCPKCDALFEPILVVASEQGSRGAWKFNHKRVQVCKCNEKEVFA